MGFKRHYIIRRLPLIMTLLAIASFAILGDGCGKKQSSNNKDHERFDSIFRCVLDAANKGDFHRSDSLGMVLYKEARNADDKTYEAYGLLARGLYPQTSEGCEERLQLVKQAEKIALTTDNDTLLSWVYNILGIYATVYETNFSQARHYYSEAIKYAKRINATNFIVSAECNIAELYHSIGDTLGHSYDMEIYNYALEKDNKALLLPAAQRCAEYYIERVNHPDRAIPFIGSVKDAGNDYLHHLLLGKYYIAIDSTEQAKRELEKALQEEYITPNVYLTYGKLLNYLGDYVESNKMLRLAEDAYHEIDSKGFNHIDTWRIMSDNYRKLGSPALALNYLELFINGSDSVKRLRNMEEINNYKVRFDVEKKELEIARNRETMKRQSITIWGVVALFALATGFYLFYTIRKRNMHRLIVRQQKDFLMEHSKPSSPSPTPQTIGSIMTASDSENQKGLTPAKSDAIWSLIEHEMEENRIYTDTTVTRDIFSERVGCNHTWFSQVIKERTGKTYLQFMNSRRIKEALKILSDPSTDVTLKDLAASLGFLSASTFYSTFRQQVGMSPAEYRKIALAENAKVEFDKNEC